MRPLGSSPCTPALIGGLAGARACLERPTGDGGEHGQESIPHWSPAAVRGDRTKGDRGVRGVYVLPLVRMREPELLSRDGDAIGGAVAGQLGHDLVVLGGEPGLFLFQGRDL